VSEAHQPSDADGLPAGAPSASGEPLEALRRALETVDREPVADRVAHFEQANETLTRELAELDELTSG
jgi:hypothetical protein